MEKQHLSLLTLFSSIWYTATSPAVLTTLVFIQCKRCLEGKNVHIQVETIMACNIEMTDMIRDEIY